VDNRNVHKRAPQNDALSGKEERSFSDRVLWKLAKSDNPEEDRLVFQSLKLLKETFLQNKLLCARIVTWSMMTAVISVLSTYVLKLALAADDPQVKFALFLVAASCYAIYQRSLPFFLVFHDGEVLRIVVQKELSAKISKKLGSAHRESLRKYINTNGSPWALNQSIPISIGNEICISVKDPILFLFYVFALWWILSWEYAVALAVVCCLISFMIKPAIRKKQEISGDALELESKKQTTLDTWAYRPRLHSDRGIVQSTERKLDTWSSRLVELYRGQTFRRAWLETGPSTVAIFLLLSSLLPYAVFVQHLSPIDAVLLATYCGAGSACFVSAFDYIMRVAEIRGELVKLGKLLHLPHRPQGNEKMRGFDGFSLRGVQIHYGDKTLFPEGLNLEIKQGTKYAFVGPSGCGKSSLLDLLARNLENCEGSSSSWTGDCLAHSNDRSICIEQFDSASYAQNVISVSQETEVLSAEPVARNIGLALEETTSDELRMQIVRTLMEKLQLPLNSIDKLCEEQSGGQRKRTQIASALAPLLKRQLINSTTPVVLLLDEALSQLDRGTAAIVQTVINELVSTSGDTIITVPHAEYAIDDDTYVIVFGADGEGIIEQGWKQELAKDTASAYNQVCNPQAI
jgi:ABC-type multidrug transport system fused ATPase/permease subunit